MQLRTALAREPTCTVLLYRQPVFVNTLQGLHLVRGCSGLLCRWPRSCTRNIPTSGFASLVRGPLWPWQLACAHARILSYRSSTVSVHSQLSTRLNALAFVYLLTFEKSDLLAQFSRSSLGIWLNARYSFVFSLRRGYFDVPVLFFGRRRRWGV